MELKTELQKVMDQAVEEKTIAGMNLLVKKNGEELCYCDTGFSDIEKRKPFERNTIFRLYSQTKPITAAAVMVLMERGLIDLFQPVAEFLPSFVHQKVMVNGKSENPVRLMFVKDLLNMTSGFFYPDEKCETGRYAGRVFQEACDRLHTDKPMTTLEFADRLAAGPLDYTPGSSWQYGTSADVLGAVVEVASGMKLGEFLKKEILEPLGMNDTAFWVPEDKRDRLATAYETITKEDGTKGIVPYKKDFLAINNAMDSEPAFESGGAGLVSTIDDYMKFAAMLLQEGELNGVRILTPRTARFMTGGMLMDCQQKAFEQWLGLEGYSYANLLRICKNPEQSGIFAIKGEYGWDGWLGAYFANFPQENMTILIGMQKTEAATFALTRKLRNIILSKI